MRTKQKLSYLFVSSNWCLYVSIALLLFVVIYMNIDTTPAAVDGISDMAEGLKKIAIIVITILISAAVMFISSILRLLLLRNSKEHRILLQYSIFAFTATYPVFVVIAFVFDFMGLR